MTLITHLSTEWSKNPPRKFDLNRFSSLLITLDVSLSAGRRVPYFIYWKVRLALVFWPWPMPSTTLASCLGLSWLWSSLRFAPTAFGSWWVYLGTLTRAPYQLWNLPSKVSWKLRLFPLLLNLKTTIKSQYFDEHSFSDNVDSAFWNVFELK